MLKNAFFVFSLSLFATALGGCHLYFGDENPPPQNGFSYCDSSGCYFCDDWGCYPTDGGGEPGWNCGNNYDCAAGCFCNSEGFCEEAGFCTPGSDQCPEGFECDDRSSCVPEGTNDSCTSDEDCPTGSFCDEQSDICVGSWTCDSSDPDADFTCGMGMVCDDRNTCVPEPCENDDMCEEGCYCDEDAGECVETTACDTQGNCPGDLVCDRDRNTCVPEDEIGPTCQGEVTCEVEAPVCPAGSTPVIEAGCYTGACMLKTECPDGAPFACSDLNNDENACIANAECSPSYNGINCTSPGGETCTSGDANCTCESFVYASCVEN